VHGSWALDSGAEGQEIAVDDKGMNMRIKGDEVAFILLGQNEGGLATRLQGVEADRSRQH
jgi:hypothetical protein